MNAKMGYHDTSIILRGENLMRIILLIFFIFVVISYTRRTSKASDFRRRNYRDTHKSSLDTTSLFSLQNTANHNSFDSYIDHYSTDICFEQSYSDSNCGCGASDGSGCNQ